MVKNEHGGVEIKTLTDGWRDSSAGGTDHLHERISEAFLLVGAFIGILQAEPCTFKLQSPQSHSGRRTLALALPHLWPEWPLSRRKKRREEIRETSSKAQRSDGRWGGKT